jgi:hypothetical protein
MHAPSSERAEAPASILRGGAHLWSKRIATRVPVHRAGCDVAADGNLVVAGSAQRAPICGATAS